MQENDFLFDSMPKVLPEGKITWQAPSNIALVKYWGKKENQIPANPSVSFTLSKSTTTTTVNYKPLEKATDNFSFDLFFEGEEKPSFRPKIAQFFTRISPYIPFIKNYHFTIQTSNSFPHSSGIASSASSMSALALCLMSIEKEINPAITNSYFNKKASFLARLGSGSACRSVAGPLVVWGKHKAVNNSTNLYGEPLQNKIDPIFNTFHDTILLVDKGQKKVSSSAGHNLMHNHPFAEQRFNQAHHNLSKLLTALEEGDLQTFINVVELEALTLHAMMMTSSPYYILMHPNTLSIINAIWQFREATQSNICFTLDAGANVHVLYPDNEKDKIYHFIKNELVAYCEGGQYICDKIGLGAKKL